MPTPNMSLPVPVNGDSDYGLPAAPFAQALELIDDHDHSDGKGVPVERVALIATDNSTLETSSNAIRVKDNGLTAAKFADDAATLPKLVVPPFDNVGGYNANGKFQNGTGSFADFAINDDAGGVAFDYGATKTITLGNRTVIIFVCLYVTQSAGSPGSFEVGVFRDGVQIRLYKNGITNISGTIPIVDCFLDDGASGSSTYKVRVKGANKSFYGASNTITTFGASINVYEQGRTDQFLGGVATSDGVLRIVEL